MLNKITQYPNKSMLQKFNLYSLEDTVFTSFKLDRSLSLFRACFSLIDHEE